MSRKAAPRREVVDVARHGDWGDVSWLHTLSCGHVTARKRRAATALLACDECLDERPSVTDPVDSLAVQMASAELAATAVRARLASALHCSPDAVQVMLGDDLRVGSALVVLTRDEIQKILTSS